VNFTKMQGLGNDFIVVDGFKEKLPENLTDLANKLCDRHFGIGADGLIVVLPSARADFRMRIINADGSEVEMCGNGIRCFAKYVYEAGLVEPGRDTFTVETLAGIMTPRLLVEGEKVVAVTVDMGEPVLERALIPMLGSGGQAVSEPLDLLDTTYHITAVSMGNPHCVIFVDNVDQIPLEKYGPALETHPVFPKKTNVHFVQVLNRQELKMRVWERGVGVTLACGTGACASLVAAVLNGKTQRRAKVYLPGGPLEIEWNEKNNHVYMTGPAETVFTGVVQKIV
jgi:diaminopimelate epimerase